MSVDPGVGALNLSRKLLQVCIAGVQPAGKPSWYPDALIFCTVLGCVFN